jgi:hypothetical protein
MAGYNGYSKSNNAVWAEDNNCFPASILARELKVKTNAIKCLVEPSEWHHTSSWFNSTDYYDGSLLIPLAKNMMPDESYYCDEDDLFEAADLLLKLRAFREPKAIGWTDDNCDVDWIEWDGSRKRPKAIEHSEKRCHVEFNGKSTYKIKTPSGYTFTKREGANGFYIYRRKNDADCQAVA